MKPIARCIALLLGAFLLLPSCAQGGGETQDTTAAVVDATAPAVETTADPNDRSQVKDNVPEDLKFNGETIRVVSRDTVNVNLYDTVGTDNMGDYVTDGVWNRNRTVEERLGVIMENTMFTGSLSEVQTQFKSLIMSGSDEFDYIHTTGNTTHGLNLYLRDLADLPYVDYEADWWWKDAMESVSLDGKTYNYIFSDMLLFCYIQTGVVYYNKTLYENAFGDPDEMYQMVTDGQWTIDKMMELTSAVYSDANGDGVENNGDIFGTIKTKNQGEETPHFLQGFDLRLYTRDENDKLIIDFDQERCITAIEKLGQYNMNTPGVFHSDQDINKSYTYFVQNSSLFFPSRMARVVADFRDMEEPYGILPYP
jgi:ABC-type glycerol-3-phosphate transport system substrate-binding protein